MHTLDKLSLFYYFLVKFKQADGKKAMSMSLSNMHRWAQKAKKERKSDVPSHND